VNIIHIAGHLGADPEVRFTSSGQKVTTLRVAAKARRGGKDETIWWRVTVWGEQHDKMISYLKKGSSVIVVGDLNKPEIFTDRDGNPQISMGITAISLMFSPFGRSDKQVGETNNSQMGESPVTPHSHNGSGSEPSDAFAGFATGAKKEGEASSQNYFAGDEEIPF